jgi:hypothetical protein
MKHPALICSHLCHQPRFYSGSWDRTSSLAEEEVEFQDLVQEVKPETSLVELKLLPSGLQYVLLNGDRETPVIISDKLSNDETRRLVATLEKYRSIIGYFLKDLKGISLSLCTHHIPMEPSSYISCF